MYYKIIFLVSYNYYEYFLYLSIFPSSLSFPTAETKSNPFYRIEILNIIREPPRYSCGFSPPLGSISPEILLIFPKSISLNPLLSCSPPHPPNFLELQLIDLPFLIWKQDWRKCQICRPSNTTAPTARGIFNIGNLKWGWECGFWNEYPASQCDHCKGLTLIVRNSSVHW